MVPTTSLSLSIRERFKNEIAEWKWPFFFQNKRARYARADELELYSSSSTTLPMKRRHQPMSRFYVKKGKRGACRQKAATVLPDRTAAA